MSAQAGMYKSGLNFILKAFSGGRFQVESFFESLLLKQHQGYDGSDLKYISAAITTTDNTATALITIPVASGKSVHGIFLVGGKQDDETDATSALVIAAGTNNGGTTAVKGTQSVTIVESASSTDVTLVADNSADTIVLKATGISSENWLWTGHGLYMFIDSAT